MSHPLPSSLPQGQVPAPAEVLLPLHGVPTSPESPHMHNPLPPMSCRLAGFGGCGRALEVWGKGGPGGGVDRKEETKTKLL